MIFVVIELCLNEIIKYRPFCVWFWDSSRLLCVASLHIFITWHVHFHHSRAVLFKVQSVAQCWSTPCLPLSCSATSAKSVREHLETFPVWHCVLLVLYKSFILIARAKKSGPSPQVGTAEYSDYITIYLSILLLMDTWIVSSLGLHWRVVLWIYFLISHLLCQALEYTAK